VSDHPRSSGEEPRIYVFLGESLHRLGRNSEAIPIFERSLAAGERQWGATSPKLVRILMGLEETLKALERYDEAESVCRRALPMVETADRTDAAYYYDFYGSLLRDLNRFDEAEHAYLHSLTLYRWAHDRDLGAGTTMNNLGTLLRYEGRFTEAERYMRRGLDLLDRNLPADDPERGIGFSNLGLLMTYTGRAAEGETFCVAPSRYIFGTEAPARRD
jgi:tetratricopeptide (TPR) repeat protein